MTNTIALQTHSQATPINSASRSYWACQLGGWGIIVLLDASVALVGPAAHLGAAAAIVIISGIAGILISHVWHHRLKKNQWLLPDRQRSWRSWSYVIAGIVICAGIQLFCVWCAFLVFFPGSQHGSLGWLPSAILIWLLVFAVWTACYAVILRLRRARRIEIEKLQLELLIKDANLRALEAQINPHFLFNCLNSIRALMYQDTDAAAVMIERLAGRLRFALHSNDVRTVTLGAELDAVRNYLEIERLRFDERLLVVESIDHNAAEIQVPPMVLQTLVENAVKYGVERSLEPCTIRIEAKSDSAMLNLCVANQGRLVESSGSTRIGLANSLQRLSLLFGDKASLQISEQDGWVVARVAIPTEGGRR